jgi:hypothetical protein
MTGTARPALRDHPTGRAYHADQLLSPLPPGLPPEVARPNGWGPDGAGGYGREKIGRCATPIGSTTGDMRRSVPGPGASTPSIGAEGLRGRLPSCRGSRPDSGLTSLGQTLARADRLVVHGINSSG